LEHAVKAVERVFERRIREKLKISDIEFGFRLENRTTYNAIAIRTVCACENVCVFDFRNGK